MQTIKDLHTFNGHPAHFWSAFLAFAIRQAQADSCRLLAKKNGTWKQLGLSPASPNPKANALISDSLIRLAETCLLQGQVVSPQGSGSDRIVFGIRLLEHSSEQPRVLIFETQNANLTQIETIIPGLQLLADAPAIYQQQREQHQAEQRRVDLAEILELMLLLNQQERFLAAAMTVVNQAVSHYSCSRVSLGWQVDGYMVLQCISHMDEFEPKMAIVNQLEAAMEEAIDQDEEIFFPAVALDGPISRDHASYAREQHVAQMLSLPLRAAGKVLGVLSCEREKLPFSEDDIRSLRIFCDQISSRLAVLHRADRGLLTRFMDGLRTFFTSLLGVEKTLTKLTGLFCCGLLLATVVIKLPYRIEAPFILRSKDVRQVSAPFAGYIDQVQAEIGQQVEEGSPLATLDSSDLVLEEAAALANRLRYLREEERARAKNTLIEMKIAQAQAAQAQAQLELIQHRLNRAQLRSPIPGIVVEGDFSERRGTPVEKGELLFKIARHEKMFAEIRIAERDIQTILPGQAGELAFVSNPRLKFPLVIDQIDPLAGSDESGNSFGVRSKIFTSAEDWWRPGMSGISKVTVGERRLLWIISHRTLNFLRLLVWW